MTHNSQTPHQRHTKPTRRLAKTLTKACVVLGLACTLSHPTPATAAVPGLPFTQLGCDGYSDSVARLYTAAFGRAPEQAGFQYWMTEYTAGRWSLPRMADHFTQSTEFKTRYGNLEQDGFIRQLYRNVLGREGESGGVAFWSAQMTKGLSRGTVLLRFAESPENIDSSGTSQPALGVFNSGLNNAWNCSGWPHPAIKFFQSTEAACIAHADEFNPMVEPDRFSNASVLGERLPSVWLIVDGRGQQLLVNLGNRTIYGTDGPDGVIPRPYMFGCPETLYLGTLDEDAVL